MATNVMKVSNSETASALSSDAVHAALVYTQWSKVQSLRERKKIEIDGQSLEIPSVVAVARQVIGGALIVTLTLIPPQARLRAES